MALDAGSAQRLVETYIWNTFTVLNHQFTLPSSQAQPSVTLRSRVNPGTYFFNPHNRSLEAGRATESCRTYSWPGKTANEAWRFTVIIRVLTVIHRAIRSKITITKRDIYYIDPAYFKSQSTIDSIIDDIAYTIGVDRVALNVEAAGKGLVAGSFVLRRNSQIIVDARGPQDTLVPRIYKDDEIDIFRTRWVLLVEKDAVFHRLVSNNYHTAALAGEGIIVTGKGYPDIFTRAFVRRLLDHISQEMSRVFPFYALVDGDPDGLAIMSIYKYGSAAHAHDNYMLTTPTLQCLGLRLSDAVSRPTIHTSNENLPLSIRDRRKVISMLQNNPIWANDGPEREYRVELQKMLILNIKAEIETLYSYEGGLEAWIDRRMFRQE